MASPPPLPGWENETPRVPKGPHSFSRRWCAPPPGSVPPAQKRKTTSAVHAELWSSLTIYPTLSCKGISVTPRGGHGTFQNEGGGQKPMAFLPGMFPCSPRVGGAEVNLWLPVTGCWGGGRVKGQPAFINRAFLKFHKLRRSSNRKSNWTLQRSTHIPSLTLLPSEKTEEMG